MSVNGNRVATKTQRPDKRAALIRNLTSKATRQMATMARNHTLASCAEGRDIKRSTGIAYRIAGGDVKETNRSTFL
ncbi:hypothetical protein R50073_44310 [Maricurvus nonylphenolicus]